MPQLAIITSCDENFAPLAKGLILSLRGIGFPTASHQLCLLDIGCSNTTLDWMHDQGVNIERFDAKKHLPFDATNLPSYTAAMSSRPFLRGIFPGFRLYLWIDADTWVQQLSSIELYQHIAATEPDKIAITPLIDHAYWHHYDVQRFLQYLTPLYETIYGEIGRDLSFKAVLSAGVFAMHHDAAIWDLWGNELPKVYSRDYRQKPEALHLAEQTALNHVLYTTGQSTFLDSTHNYHLCAGPARRGPDGCIVKGCPPHHPLGIVHLCNFTKLAKTYIERQFLFAGGGYLTPDEKEKLHQSRSKRG